MTGRKIKVKRRVVISVPCWGNKYIDKFTLLSLPSLITRGNIPAILSKGYEVELAIYSKKSDIALLKKAKVFLSVPVAVSISFIDIDSINKKNSRCNIELFSLCHEDTLQKAIPNNDLIILLCCDALVNSTGLSFAVEKVEQGYKAVLNSAVRINYEDCLDSLVEQVDSEGLLKLPSEVMVDLVLNYMHDDEKKLARPTRYTSDGWPGICSWFVEGKVYLKHTFYYNPTLVVAEAGMSLGGATFDSSEMMDFFSKQWEKVYVVSEQKELLILDLADKYVNHLPIKVGYQNASDFVKFSLSGKMPEWQKIIFKYECLFSSQHESESDTLAIKTEAKLFISKIKFWFDLFDNNPEILADENIKYISDKFLNRLNLCPIKVEKMVNDLVKKYRGGCVVLYGMGEFCEFIVKQYKFPNCKIVLSDSNSEKASRSRWGQQSISVEEIKGIADGNGDIAKSLNLLVDKSANYMGMRSTRFAMIVENNIIQELISRVAVP